MYDEEFVLSVSDWYHDQMTDLIPKFLNKANPTGAEPVPDSALFNDTQNLEVKIEAGKTYLFRMVNIGAFAGQRVWFEGHTMKIVEVDGIYTDPFEADMIYLTAAQRYSFLITAKNDTNANYAFVGSMDTVRSPSCSIYPRTNRPRIYSTASLIPSTTTLQDGLSMTRTRISQSQSSSMSSQTSMTSTLCRMTRSRS